MKELLDGIKDIPIPSRETLLAEGMALDENGKDILNPFYGKTHTEESNQARREYQTAVRAKDDNHGVKINDRKKYHHETVA